MKELILLFLFLMTTLAHAQLNTMQDRPGLVWREIESDNFKVVYPAHMRPKAQYILNLLQHYKDKVSDTYDIDTRKYTLILRSELASPNGFVTLMPRRSEWYSAQAITPLVSSLEWYQSLAIHEYRHMVQFDYFKRPNVEWGYWLFGDLGGAALMAASAPPWYFEGDAVWAETVLSNAGRGRAPRFSARMKSLMINNQIPTYDEFIGGVYTNVLPNHYVYGYFLITRAVKIYGEKVWAEVVAQAAGYPVNLYTFYNAFRKVTGEDFIDFYYDTMRELQKEWKEDPLPGNHTKGNELYTRYEYPVVDEGSLYFLKWDLDSFWSLYRRDGALTTKVAELNVSPSLSKTDIKRGKFAYAQPLPDNRYSFKSFSDIYLLDLKSGEQKRVTMEARAYHPVIHPHKDLIMAVEFVDSFYYQISVYDFEGNKVNFFKPEGYDVAEAVWLENGEVAALLLDPQGLKHFAAINLDNKSYQILKEAGRNNVYALRPFGNNLLFEADDQGVVNVFSLNLDKKPESAALARCSNETIAAYRPYPAKGGFYYVAETKNGQRLEKAPYQCEQVAPDFLSDFDKYLGKGPSDNYFNAAPETVENFQKLFADRWGEEDFFELEEGFTPHSWSFIGGRGYQVSLTTQNFLNTFGASVTVGEDVNEARPYAQLSLSYRKYYPVFSLNLSYDERNTDLSEWTEARAGLAMTLPYIFRKNLYQGSHALTLAGEQIEISDRMFADLYELDDDQVFMTTAAFSTSLLKDTSLRQLQPRWGYSLQAIYKNAKANQDEDFSSYLGHGNLNLYFPGLKFNHGLKLGLTAEYRPERDRTYRIESPSAVVNEYAFSRGYDFEYVDAWQKASLNYILPAAYPNRSFGRWIYFNRIYANLFFDHTKIEDEADYTLNSAGAELFFESLTFRKLPLTYGLRFIDKLDDEESQTDFFFRLNVAI